MPYAISTNYKLAVNDETTWGTPVASGAKFVRLTDANLKPDLNFVESNEINASHRQTADTVLVSAKGSGTVNGELSYTTFDPFFQSLFGSTFVPVTTVRTLKIGTTRKALTLQEQYSDLTTIFHAYRGAIVNSFSLNLQVGQIVNCSFGFMSKKPTVEAATVIGTPSAANTNPVMNPLADVRVLQEGATPTTITGVQSIALNIQNDITEIAGLGSADPLDMAPARIKVSGTISLFKQESALLTKLMAGTATKLIFKIGGASTLNYEFTLPNVKYTSYDGGASQSNPIMERFGFTALYDATDSAFKLIGND